MNDPPESSPSTPHDVPGRASDAEAGTDGAYFFGSSEDEERRLQTQGRLFNTWTHHVLQTAGIRGGMKVLDVGSGAGDVALLLAEIVGPTGMVVGVDRDTHFLETARLRVRRAGLCNVSFICDDIGHVSLDHDFDALVGRCVLFFLQDPVAVLTRLAAHVRRGGVIVFQEPGNAALKPAAAPACVLLERMWAWIMETYRRAGLDESFGLKLFKIFVDAGLPEPEMHLDAAVGGGTEWAGYDYMASLVRVLLPQMVKFGVVSEPEVGIETLADRLRTEIVGTGGAVTTWSFISAWACRA
jgi:SAM-dependent methyltransferase